MNVTLIDGANLLMRAVYALSKRYSENPGLAAEPLSTFTSMIAKYCRLTSPSKVMLCWDSDHSDFRRKILPTYKGQRLPAPESDGPDIFDKAKELVTALGLEQFEVPGVEADDIISEYVRMYKSENVHIISADKDFSQLLDEKVTIWHPGDNNPLTLDRWNRQNGFTPEQYVLILALTGDKVDNIPGVKGYGPKTAIKKLAASDWSIVQMIRDAGEDFDSETFIRNAALVDLRSGYIKVDVPPIGWFNPVEGPKDPRWPQLLKYLDDNKLKMIRYNMIQGKLWEV